MRVLRVIGTVKTPTGLVEALPGGPVDVDAIVDLRPAEQDGEPIGRPGQEWVDVWLYANRRWVKVGTIQPLGASDQVRWWRPWTVRRIRIGGCLGRPDAIALCVWAAQQAVDELHDQDVQDQAVDAKARVGGGAW